jgi:NADPH:quinone reductase-like Zn-dependent oxidoreductase
MYALRAHGTVSDALRYEEAPVPQPGTGDVLVRVLAASFTPGELEWPSTAVDRVGHDRLPAIPSHEFCGVVAAVGFGASGWSVGDEVFGICDWYRDGAAAQYVAVEARNLARKPVRCSATEAASLSLAGLTALEGLRRHAAVAPGETVLVVGAAGGVGVYAVQLARHFGARVVGAGRVRQERAIRALADEFVDIERDDWTDVLDEVDVVFDLVGGRVLERLVAQRHERTRTVSIVEPGEGVRFFVVEADRSALADLAELVDTGAIRPVVGATAPVADGVREFVDRRAVAGKTVLTVPDGDDAFT